MKPACYTYSVSCGYHYDKSSKIERAERKEEKEVKRLQELPSIELEKVVNTFFRIH